MFAQGYYPYSLLGLSIDEKAYNPSTRISIHDSDRHSADGKLSARESDNVVELVHIKTSLTLLPLRSYEGR